MNNIPILKLYAVSIIYYKDSKLINDIIFYPAYNAEQAIGWGALYYNNNLCKGNFSSLQGVWVQPAPLDNWTPPQTNE